MKGIPNKKKAELARKINLLRELNLIDEGTKSNRLRVFDVDHLIVLSFHL